MTVVFLALVCAVGLFGCSGKTSESDSGTYKGSLKTYSEAVDGTWQVDGNTYKYKLEISGRMPKADKNSTFVILSNLESITFEQAWKAAGLSSDSKDYFDAKDAVIVDVK